MKMRGGLPGSVIRAISADDSRWRNTQTHKASEIRSEGRRQSGETAARVCIREVDSNELHSNSVGESSIAKKKNPLE